MSKDSSEKFSHNPTGMDPTSPDYVQLISGENAPFETAQKQFEKALDEKKHWEGITKALENCRDIVYTQNEFWLKLPDSSIIDLKIAQDRIDRDRPAFDKSDFLLFGEDFPSILKKIIVVLEPDFSGEIPDGKDSKLLEKLIATPDALIEELLEKTKIDSSLLLLAINSSYQVLISKSASKIRSEFERTKWDHGYCPMCGSDPEMGKIVSSGGHFYLVCSLCFTEWKYPRLKCPFCGNEEQDKLGHFSTEEYPGYRVNICRNCNSYLKVTLEKELGRSHIPVFDTIYTVELGSVAINEGFKAGEIMFSEPEGSG